MGLMDVLKDPNYINANPETKMAIFDKFSSADKNYTEANDETKLAIRQKFGVEATPYNLKVMDDSGKIDIQKAPKEEPKASVSIGPMLTKAAESVYEALPSTETLFGKGTPEEAGIGERIAKVGETGVAGSLIAGGVKALGAPMVAVGTKLEGMPSSRAKAIGGSLVGLGGLAQKITPGGVYAAGGLSAMGETAEQTASAMGLGREYQVGAGMLATPLTQLAAELPEKAIDLVVRSPLKYLLKGMLPDPIEARASQLRKDAIDKARELMGIGANSDAGKILDQSLKEGVALKQLKLLQDAEQQRLLEQARIEKLRGVQSEQQRAQQQALEDIERQKSGVSAPLDEERFGSNLQGEIVATQNPIIEQRAGQYKKLLDEAIESARARQKQGDFWQNSEGGQAVKQYWLSRIKKGEFTKAQENEITSILNDIYTGGEKQVTVPAGKLKTLQPERTKTVSSPKDINAVDSWIRVLGDKANYGIETEGAKALSANQAREIRKTLTEGIGERGQEVGGIYKWEPKFGEAKGLYSEKSELLNAWDTKAGKKVLSSETKGIDVPKQFFNSRAGYDELVKQLGGNEQKAAKYGTQYALGQVQKLEKPEQITKWLSDPKNGWIDKIPELRQQITQYGEKQSQLMGKAERAGATVERLGKEIPKLEANQKTWSESVDKTAQSMYKDIIGDSKPGVAFQKILLSDKFSDTERKALSTYIGQNPEARKLVPDAVKSILTDLAPNKVVSTFDNRIVPVLESTGIMNKAQIADVRKKALAIAEADAKDYTISKDKKGLKAINFVYQSINAQVAGRVAGAIPSVGEE